MPFLRSKERNANLYLVRNSSSDGKPNNKEEPKSKKKKKGHIFSFEDRLSASPRPCLNSKRCSPSLTSHTESNKRGSKGDPFLEMMKIKFKAASIKNRNILSKKEPEKSMKCKRDERGRKVCLKNNEATKVKSNYRSLEKMERKEKNKKNENHKKSKTEKPYNGCKQESTKKSKSENRNKASKLNLMLILLNITEKMANKHSLLQINDPNENIELLDSIISDMKMENQSKPKSNLKVENKKSTDDKKVGPSNLHRTVSRQDKKDGPSKIHQSRSNDKVKAKGINKSTSTSKRKNEHTGKPTIDEKSKPSREIKKTNKNIKLSENLFKNKSKENMKLLGMKKRGLKHMKNSEDLVKHNTKPTVKASNVSRSTKGSNARQYNNPLIASGGTFDKILGRSNEIMGIDNKKFKSELTTTSVSTRKSQ